jgi:MSHA biogenesis protein MshQ
MKHFARLFFAAVLAWLVGMPASWAQTYTATADAATQAAYPWIDISTTGTQVPLDDDGISADVPLGFNFTFGSTTYSTVNITANGMLQFGAGTSPAYLNSALPLTGSGGEPNIDAAMVPLWDDLNPNSNGTLIRYRATGTSPNRVFVVSWLAVPYYCYNNGPTCNNGQNQTQSLSATFQVQVHEQGHFVYRYGVVDGAGGTHTAGPELSNPLGATVGYELTNANYVQYSFRAANVPNNRTILWQRPVTVTAPGGFNAFDTGTAAGSITGFIRTKIAGTAFNLAVVALNTTRTAVHTTFTGDVRVELLDASNNTGALNATTGCRASWTSVLSTSTLNFASGDSGRDTLAHTQANSWRDVRVRISYPASGTATVIGCSTDNFAIRPASFENFSVTDSNASTAGTTRSLSNTGATGGVVHKAGRPFTVRATAVNSSGVATTLYNGTPTHQTSSCGGTYPCGSNVGALTLALVNTAGTGALSDTNASYPEAGAFNLQLVDSSFAGEDASDGSTAAEREIRSSTITVGRFVPDDFGWAVTATPQLQAACGSFTYYGQPFGYAIAPQATLLPRNAAGTTLANYPSTRYSGINPVTINVGYAPASLVVAGATIPTVTAVGSTGTATVVGPGPTHTLALARTTNAPQAESATAAASIALTWTATDNSETAVTGNETISGAHTFTPIAFAGSASNFRYGQLKLGSAYGSELLPLAVPIETQYWNGTGFVTNAADSCTVLPTSSVSLANFRGSLAACETAPTATSLSFTSGRAVMRLQASGNGNSGSVDGTLQLGASLAPSGAVRCAATGGTTSAAVPANLPWLQSRPPGGSTYDQNPSARFSFGQHKSPLIQLREMY